MPDVPSTSSRSVFTSDLRRIRESRGLTLEGLHEATKIPLSVLEDFEETGLFDNPMFNRVYLRSLVRTYASYVGIPTKAMLEALDEALLESYKGDLARLYLETPPTSTGAPSVDVVTPSAPAATESTSTPEDPSPEDALVEEPPAEETAVGDTSLKEPPAEETAVDGTLAEASSDEEEVVDDAAVATSPAKDTAVDEPAVEETRVEDAADDEPAIEASPAEETTVEKKPAPEEDAVVQEIQQMLRVGEKARAEASAATTVPEAVPPRGRTRPPMLTTAEATRQSPGGRVQPMDVKRRAWYTQWMIIVVAVVGFAAAIWAVLVLLQRPDDTSRGQLATVDTAAVDTAAAIPAGPPRPQLTLDDTLYVVLLAVEKVERIQIRRDDDLLRSYWIEQDVAKAFPALERIVFENRLDLIRLFVEGFEYPTGIRDEEDRVVITRAGLQAMADTLTASPVLLPTPPDTIPLWPVRGQ